MYETSSLSQVFTPRCNLKRVVNFPDKMLNISPVSGHHFMCVCSHYSAPATGAPAEVFPPPSPCTTPPRRSHPLLPSLSRGFAALSLLLCQDGSRGRHSRVAGTGKGAAGGYNSGSSGLRRRHQVMHPLLFIFQSGLPLWELPDRRTLLYRSSLLLV